MKRARVKLAGLSACCGSGLDLRRCGRRRRSGSADAAGSSRQRDANRRLIALPLPLANAAFARRLFMKLCWSVLKRPVLEVERMTAFLGTEELGQG